MGFLSRLFGRGRAKRTPIDLPPRDRLEASHLSELHAYAAKAGIDRYRLMRKEALVEALLERSGQSNGSSPSRTAEPVSTPTVAEKEAPAGRPVRRERQESRRRQSDGEPVRKAPEREEPAESEPEPETHDVRGFVDLTRRGHGFLRVSGLTRSADDPYLSRSQVRKFDLRAGDELTGRARSPRRSERYPSLIQIDSIDGEPAQQRDRSEAFDELPAAARPDAAFSLAGSAGDRQGRMLELMAPFGPGQRVLVGAPAGAGATTLVRELAVALSKPTGTEVIAALVDSRPEDSADWSGSEVQVYSSPADARQAAHLGLAELAVERAKRRAEAGRDAIVIIDSATRLSRAYDAAARGGRGSESGGGAEAVKRLFAFARNVEGAGSLTIVMTARTDTDDSVYSSLADIANAEILLDAELARSGKYPAIDLDRTHARSDEGLVGDEMQHRLAALRSVVRSLDQAEAWDFLVEKLDDSESTEQLLRD